MEYQALFSKKNNLLSAKVTFNVQLTHCAPLTTEQTFWFLFFREKKLTFQVNYMLGSSVNLSMVNVLKFRTAKCLTKFHMQRV